MSQPFPAKGHPKGLYILFATEMWERFNYYGMRAILILFMTKALLFDKVFASTLYGSYTSLIYLTPLIGGYIADRYWGSGRSIIAGGLLMAIGEFLLFFCGSLYDSNESLSALLFFSGLGFMITGNGFFKPNISSLVGQLYPKGDRRIDSAYTIFYMGINVGGALGPLICGFVGDTGNPADFKWAFLVAGIGMLISVIIQKIYQNRYVINPAGQPIGVVPADSPKKALAPVIVLGGLILLSTLMIGLLYIDAEKFSFLQYLLLASAIFIAIFIFADKSLNKIEKQRVGVIFTVSFFVIFFWAAFEQAGASLTFFADEQTDRHLGLVIPAFVIYILSAGLLFYLSTLMINANKKLTEEAALKNAVNLLLVLAIGGILYLNISLIGGGSEPISIDELPPSVFQSLNSTFVIIFAPLFAWLWLKLGKYEPSAPTKMALGLFLLAVGYLWIAFGVKDVDSTVKVSMMWLVGMYALHTWGELSMSPIGLSLVNKLSPFKFASLLMAVWFLANAAANKLAGILSTLYPEDGKTKGFLGYEITTLYEFFMLFVGMAGVASLILFLISKKLQKMMHNDKE